MSTTDPKTNLPVELWDIEKLYPHAKNAKKHPKEQLEKLARSIKRFGLANPLNIEPDGCIITGVGRWTAMREILGLKRIPVVVRTDLKKDEADALRLSDNQVVSNEYDTDLMTEELQRLAGTDETLPLDAGFDIEELERTGEEIGEIDNSKFIENIPEAVEEQKTENKEKESEIDATAAPIADAFGFKRMTVEQSRAVRDFMSKIEIATGKLGAEALIAWIRTQPIAS